MELHPRLQQPALRAAHAARRVITQSWTPLGRGTAFAAPEVTAIAARLGVSPAQVILRWHLDLGLSVIPRSTRPEGLSENLAAQGLTLTPEDHTAFASLDTGARTGPDPATIG